MAPKKSRDTRPELRGRIWEQLKGSDEGGRPGEWSARKCQLLVAEYEKQGDCVLTGREDEAARSLERRADLDWHAIDGEADARDGATPRRDLPRTVR